MILSLSTTTPLCVYERAVSLVSYIKVINELGAEADICQIK